MGCSLWGHYESDMTERLHFDFHCHALEKEMATHSSVLAWKLPWTEEPSGLQSMECKEPDMIEPLSTHTPVCPCGSSAVERKERLRHRGPWAVFMLDGE